MHTIKLRHPRSVTLVALRELSDLSLHFPVHICTITTQYSPHSPPKKAISILSTVHYGIGNWELMFNKNIKAEETETEIRVRKMKV